MLTSARRTGSQKPIAIPGRRPHRQTGEFVLVLGPAEKKQPGAAEGERVLRILLEHLPASEAAKLASKITGVPKKELYAIAIKPTK